DRLRAGVHGQDEVLAAQLGELVAERAELVVQERAAGQGHPVELLAGGRDEAGVAVAEVQGGVAGEAVEVAPALHVGDPGALAGGDDDGQRVVVVRGPALGFFDRGKHKRHARTSRVQHFGPPPALCSSDTSTGTGWNPFDVSAAARRVAAAGRTTRCPSLTAL